ncbi:hypothetical protein DPMN_000371 [Dreissena polymorpha]|uniref:B box-type domain-containing protein n=1 Tax=Dreissena polymorpha TaxID=45954 RepID=A0A9D4RPF9_DREPO|nr:hypothetical protein DPMN_000371 [Dreissena polymorpha]
MASRRLHDSNGDNAGDFIGECTVTQSCEPCTKSNVSKTATVFCKGCNEFVCDACKNPHTVYKAGKHNIVNLQDNKSAPVIIDMKGMHKCNEHAREIEFFCKDHSKLCCLSCVLIHRKCDQLDEIAKVSKQTRPYLQGIKQSFIKLQSDVDALIAECKQSENGLNESIAQISSEVDTLKDRIIKLFEEAKQKLTSEAKQFKTAAIKQIGNKRGASLKVKEELNKVLSMCCVVLDRGTHSQQYIYSELMKEKRKTIESTIDDQRKIKYSSTMTVSFPKQVTSLLQIGSNSIKLNYDGYKTAGRKFLQTACETFFDDGTVGDRETFPRSIPTNPAEIMALKEKQSSLEVVIYSDSVDNIQKCKTVLEKGLEDAMMTDKIAEYQELIKGLTKEEVEGLDCGSLLVNFKIDQAAGIITIHGEPGQVHQAVTDIRGKLNEIMKEKNDKEQ